MKEMCQEMIRLRVKLNILGIPWTDESDSRFERTKLAEAHSLSPLERKGKRMDIHDFGIDRTVFSVKDKKFSVVNGFCTKGGYEPIVLNENQGLLEMMFSGQDPIGYLTADDIIDLVNAIRKGE